MKWRSDQFDPEGLLDMCAYGVAKFKAGECDAVRFNVFNEAEAVRVRQIMQECHPGVPHAISVLAALATPTPAGDAR